MYNVARAAISLSCNDSLSIVFDENASKDPDITTKSPLKSSFDVISDLSMPSNLSKNLASGDNDDSFIVFANSEDLNHNSKGLSEARANTSVNKPLERVKECNEFTKIEASSIEKKKKKKGHTRHWSLDMCVKSTTDDVRVPSSKMYLYIQMQLCRRDSLHDWLRNNRTYSSREGKIKTLFSQIVSAVEYVHLAGLIHRDLKPSNIFFAPDGKVKVGDFGLVTAMADSSQDGDGPPDALDVHQRHTYRVGTHLYMSPEQLRGRRYSYKVDIYSLGLVLFELLQPFGTEAERVRSLLAIREGGWPQGFSRNFSNEMEVLKLMLSEDPMRRPTAAGVRARAPLFEPTDERWHFTLPTLVNA
ncbi:unnamed protein product [Plutella xylostella]|uniref:non-specific serine/threonine protein kinase n=1 Tax=Plutella xylostella TaxID=51655 RepID=A0A8S4EA75_PLUXY|nr:unnamed protein product [Plutella xylostella]